MRERPAAKKKVARFMYAAHLKHLFPQSKCVIPISVGQHYHEGEKFSAIMRLVNKHFKECTIIVADTLQRHTLSLFHPNLNENELFQLALKNDDAWLERNENTFQQLTIPYQVTRWEDWRQRLEFPEKSLLIEKLYKEDNHFNQALLVTANAFIDRMKKRLTDLNYEKALKQSLKYIKEECAFDFVLIKDLILFALYPNDWPPAFGIFDEKLVRLYDSHLLRHLVVDFRR